MMAALRDTKPLASFSHRAFLKMENGGIFHHIECGWVFGLSTTSEAGNRAQMLTSETRFAVLLFTDIVGSSELKHRHGVPAYRDALEIHNTHFERLVQACRDIRILHNMGDGYFAEATGVVAAIRFALLFQDAMREGPWADLRLVTRVGIHAGEVSVLDAEGGSGIVAPAADLAARVMSLAVGGQILVTRLLFDEGRPFIREHPESGDKFPVPLVWLAHGPYLLKGCAEPVEIFEVGAEGLAPLAPPPDNEKARRAVRPGEEETLGWRPAIGLEIPGRTGWFLTERLGVGGFGEVWTGEHSKLSQRRAFKFCFDDQRLRALKREVTLTRLLRGTLGERDDIVRIHDLKLDCPPYYLESDYAPHGNLLQWAARQGGLANIPLDQRIGLVARAATAVAAAHGVGVLHKDIKPTNILIFEGLDGMPRPRLVDFGIGMLVDSAVPGQHGITAAGFTRATIEHSTGTPSYSPPEYLAGRPYTIQGDIYSLGVLLYQLVAAKPLDPPAAGWERDVPDLLLREDIAACVDGDPSRRLPSAAELAERLVNLDRRRSEAAEADDLAKKSAQRAAELARHKHRRRTFLVTSIFGLSGVGAGWLGLRTLSAQRPCSVEIETNPPGAEVWRDADNTGAKTPFREEVKKNSCVVYTLKANGFLDDINPVEVTSERIKLKINLARPVDAMAGEHAFQACLITLENKVEYKRARETTWSKAYPGLILSEADRIRTRQRSRATISLGKDYCLRLDQFTSIEITNELLKDPQRGAIFLFSRPPEENIDIRYPAANDALKG